VYKRSRKVPPAPLSATTGVEEVVVASDVVVVVDSGSVVDIADVVTVGVVDTEVLVVAVDAGCVVVTN